MSAAPETRVCGFCDTRLVRCPAVPLWWIDADPGPGRGECPESTGGHQAWPAATLAMVRLPQPRLPQPRQADADAGPALRARPTGVRRRPPVTDHQGSLFDGLEAS